MLGGPTEPVGLLGTCSLLRSEVVVGTANPELQATGGGGRPAEDLRLARRLPSSGDPLLPSAVSCLGPEVQNNKPAAAGEEGLQGADPRSWFAGAVTTCRSQPPRCLQCNLRDLLTLEDVWWSSRRPWAAQSTTLRGGIKVGGRHH